MINLDSITNKYLINEQHDPNTFIECLNTMDDVYENIHDYNSR